MLATEVAGTVFALGDRNLVAARDATRITWVREAARPSPGRRPIRDRCVQLAMDGNGSDRVDGWLRVATRFASHALLFGPDSEWVARRLVAADTTCMVVRCYDQTDAQGVARLVCEPGGTVLCTLFGLLVLPARYSTLRPV